MANDWAPSGLISQDFECKKSVSLCVKLVQMPLSNFTLHLPYSPDVGYPAGVKWGRASLSSIHLMRRRQKSRKHHRVHTGGQQLPKNCEICNKQTNKRTNEQISSFTIYTPTWPFGGIIHSAISCSCLFCTQNLHIRRSQAWGSNSHLFSTRPISK